MPSVRCDDVIDAFIVKAGLLNLLGKEARVLNSLHVGIGAKAINFAYTQHKWFVGNKRSSDVQAPCEALIHRTRLSTFLNIGAKCRTSTTYCTTHSAVHRLLSFRLLFLRIETRTFEYSLPLKVKEMIKILFFPPTSKSRSFIYNIANVAMRA